jgi:hypothetical protein
VDVIRFSLDASGVREMLAEVNELLELDLALHADGGKLLAEVGSHIVYFREHPSDAFFIDSEFVSASGNGTGDCRVHLKPSDQLLKFVLALRALKRELGVGVAV